uniref:Jasmintide 2 n=1 Tax=Jasminum sambac TaxID=660624 RepID=A0A0S2KUS2_9LAMI|nr:jasmintide 2 precursor [Jasminum sambac]
MEKASIKLTVLTLFLVAIALPVLKVEAREPPQTVRIPAVLEVETKEMQQTLSMPVAKIDANELPRLTLSKQPNQLCLQCRSDDDCNIIWRICRYGCCNVI